MPLITGVRTAGRDRASGRGWGGELRVVVLDDGRSLLVDAEQVARHRLAPGEAVDAELAGRLEAQDQYLRTRAAAIRLLAVRPRSVAELRLRLRRDRIAGERVAAVIRDLIAAGYLDDLAFARAWVGGRASSRLCGVQRLRRELHEKGVASAIIEQAIREAYGEEDLPVVEERYARALVERRLRAYRGLSADVRRRRLAGVLERRGFSAGTIVRVLRSVGGAPVSEPQCDA